MKDLDGNGGSNNNIIIIKISNLKDIDRMYWLEI